MASALLILTGGEGLSVPSAVGLHHLLESDGLALTALFHRSKLGWSM